MKKLMEILSCILGEKFEQCGYDREYGRVIVSNRPDLCQFQCNGALPAAKKFKKAPIEIAKEVLELLKREESFENISIAGPGFINMNITDSCLTEYVNNLNKDEKFGCSVSENPLTIIMDYGGANVAKPLHVGHLRPATIGESIKRISRYLGHKVISDVHLGDWGLQIGMVISEVKRRNPELPYFEESFKGDYPKQAPFNIDELEDIYPAASKLAKSDEAAMVEARKATFELQSGKPGYVALWKHILNVSIADLKKNYGSLNVEFDLWKGESDCEKYLDQVVNYLRDGGYTYESEGALVVDVSKETDTYILPPFMVLKSDGATLYSTTDLATIWERVKDYDPDEIIYVVDKRQGLHFEQVFRCAKKTKIAGDKLKLQFIGNGTMNGKDGKPFKTRDGGVMRLQALVETIRDNVRGKLKEDRDIEAGEREEIARIVGLAAIKYSDLSNQTTKDYIFDIDKFVSFEGNTGPYILYTLVRIKSILRKAEVERTAHSSSILPPYSPIERDLLLKLSKFNEVIELCYEDKAPNKLCEYVYELSNLFNKFYHENRILAEENSQKKMSWLSLIELIQNILEASLELLGMEVPERM